MTLGVVPEELHFSSVTSGAHDDFQKVTQMARAMVTALVMSPRLVPFLTMKVIPHLELTNHSATRPLERLIWK